MNMDFDTMRDTMTAAAEPEDYTGADGLLYCGKCRKPKESYFSEGKTLFGRDRHPAECDCQRKIREERQAAEEHRRHLETVEELKRRGFSDTAMREPADRYRPLFRRPLGGNAGEKAGLPVLGARRERQKLPCRLYCKRPHGERGFRLYDELCRDTQRPCRQL